MDVRFAGKVALVTGGASGIGLAAATRLLAEGATVVVADVQSPAGEPGERLSADDRAHLVSCDVTDAAAVEAVVDRIVDAHGGVDVLVHAAGIAHVGTVLETSEAAWDRVMAVNLKGAFLCCRAVARVMQGRGRGAIVLVASEEGVVGGARAAAYCASKGGVIQLTRAMAVDHGPEGLRVNCVCPGPVQTPLLQAFFEAKPDPLAAARAATDSTVLRRIGRPEEIASLIAFAASDEASYLTGSILMADGGVTAQ